MRSGLKAFTQPTQAIAKARLARSINAMDSRSPAISPSATSLPVSRPSLARSARNGDPPGGRPSAPEPFAAPEASSSDRRAAFANPEPDTIASRQPRPPQPQIGPPSSIRQMWPISPAAPSGPSIRRPS
jgi:hypothetical protein